MGEPQKVFLHRDHTSQINDPQKTQGVLLGREQKREGRRELL